jgi:hypothetical protein
MDGRHMPNTEDFALVVGINNYPGFGNLLGAVNDAKAFSTWLTDPQGGDVPEANIRLITSDDYPPPTGVIDAHPTIDDIESYLREIVIRAGENRAGRRLYIFMAGHGIQPISTFSSTMTECALLPANADTTTLRRHMPATEYLHWFRASGLFDEVVLFMDCGRDIAYNTAKNSVPWDRQITIGPGAKYMIGLANSEGAKFRESENTVGFGGNFTRALLKGLNQRMGKTNARGEITSHTLRDFVHNELSQLKVGGYSMQLPVFAQDALEDRQIVFGKPSKSSMRPVRIRAKNAIEHADLFNGKLELISRLDLENGDWEGELAVGLYVVRIPGRNTTPFQVFGEGRIEVEI